MFKKSNFRHYYCYLLWAIPLLAFFLIRFKRENDIWFLLSHGRYVLSHGFPHVEFLTIHHNFDFVMQQWLSSVIFYTVYHYLGSFALYLFLFLLNCIILYLFYQICYVISKKNVFASVVSATFTSFLVALFWVTPRPHVFSIIIFQLFFLFMERYLAYQNKRDLWYIVILSFLLIQFHAALWLCLFVFFMPYLVEQVYFMVVRKESFFLPILKCFCGSFLVGIFNPYGLKAMFYSLQSYGIPYLNHLIIEMHHFTLVGDKSDQINSYFFLGIFSIICFFMIYGKKKNNLHQVFLFLGTFFMGLLNFRNIIFFIIFTYPFMSKYISKKESRKKTISMTYYVILGCILIGCFIYKGISHHYIIPNSNDEVVSYLNKNAKKNIRLYTGFDDGSYYEYYGYKVYIDPRAEVFLKKNNHQADILFEYYQLLSAKLSMEQFLEKYQFDYLIVHKKDLLYSYLKGHQGYSLVFHNDDTSNYLFQKN